jgi:pimeloyl-ACP methyl ester carboxylesterase
MRSGPRRWGLVAGLPAVTVGPRFGAYLTPGVPLVGRLAAVGSHAVRDAGTDPRWRRGERPGRDRPTAEDEGDASITRRRRASPVANATTTPPRRSLPPGATPTRSDPAVDATASRTNTPCRIGRDVASVDTTAARERTDVGLRGRPDGPHGYHDARRTPAHDSRRDPYARRPLAVTARLPAGRTRPGRRPSRYEFSTATVRFTSGGERCVADLYRPDRPADPPVVVMGNGFGMARTVGLPAIAERYAEAGIAALAFDYRHHGDSGGEPRGLVVGDRLVADYGAALDATRRVDGVDGSRAVLWGFSIGGGAALAAAAGETRVRAVVARTPVVDGRAVALARGPGFLARATLAGLRDRLGGVVGRPYAVPVAAAPDPDGDGDGDAGGELAALPPAAGAALRDLLPAGVDPPTVPARSLPALARFRPVADADRIVAPTFLLAGGDDEVVPASSVVAAADTVPRASLLRLPIGHFDAVDAGGPDFEEALAHELAFVRRHLPVDA